MPRKSKDPNAVRRVSLSMLAEYLNLSPATVSFVLNNVPGRSIPPVTRERVKAAARKFGYRPNLIARSLQGSATRTIGVLLPELGEGYHAGVMGGVGELLMKEGYFYFTAHHRHRADLIEEYPRMLLARGVDGILAIDTKLPPKMPLPTVSVAGHAAIAGVTNVMLDHHKAAQLALGHLHSLGHRKIAYMQGQSFSSDSQSRWRATLQEARELGLQVTPELTIRLEQDMTSPELGYPGVRQLMEKRGKFTAVLCFNDISAIGAIRALHDGGLRVPQDVSVFGFDDIQSASFHVPSLTTIRQPLHSIGSTAAGLLLRKLAGEALPAVVKMAPELMVRESTSAARRS